MTKKIKLNAEKTNSVYRLINSVAFHLANETSNAPKIASERQKKYYSIQRNLRASFISYDSEAKLATALQPLEKLEALKTAKKTPVSYLAIPKAKAKTTTKAKRV